MLSDGNKLINWIQDTLINPNTGEPFRLADFQKDYIIGLFAPVVKVSYFSVSRGNAKTTLCACIALAVLYSDIFFKPNIGMFATSVAQATADDGVYGLCVAMIQCSDKLSDKSLTKISFNNNAAYIRCLANNGTIRVVASKTDDRLLGGSYGLAIIDEGAASHWTETRVKYITQSAGKVPGSKTIIISTPNSMQSAFYKTRKRVMAGEASQFVHWVEFAAKDTDDPSDKSVWRKANPAIDAGFLDITAVEMSYLDDPPYMFSMFRLGMHDISNVGEGWLGTLGAKHYDATTSATPILIDDTVPCWVGIDAAHSNDWCAVVILQLRAGKWYSKCRTWEPMPGTVDIDDVCDYVRELNDLYTPEAIAYDPSQFRETARMLDREGLPMLEVPQSNDRLVPAFKKLHKLIIDGDFIHDDDPQYRMQMLIPMLKPQPSGGYTVYKKHKNQAQKIDAIYATIDALYASGETGEAYNAENYWVA